MPALAIFIVLGLLSVENIGDPPWLSVGLGLALSATFLEPYFAGPRAALVNGSAAALALLSTPKNSVEILWWALFGVMVVVTVLGLIASVSRSGALNRVAKDVASRLGRASVVGGSLLLLFVLVLAVDEQSDFELLLVGSAVLVTAVSADWVRLFSVTRRNAATATAVAALGPRMLLIAETPHDFSPGTAVDVEAGARVVPATVMARLPHADGPRYQIALTSDCIELCPYLPCDVTVSASATGGRLVGSVGAGSTQNTLEFDPLDGLSVGSPVSVRREEKDVLYQVVDSRLVDSTWSGARAVVSRTRARLVGSPENQRVVGGTNLPEAHEPIYAAEGLSGDLPDGFHEVGLLKGTSVRIGLLLDRGRQGHIAVLGMSGMGKTVAATRLCEAFAENYVVIALDTTGEYASRLGVSKWTPGDFKTVGYFVHEPAGHQPPKATEFIKQCMDAGSQEYRAGQEPTPRAVLLEEAHSFVPEFPLALREHQRPIGESTRYIMQARKFGITFVVVSQRTAVVSKTALSQCENYIILKTLDKTSLEYFESVVGSEVRNAIPTLGRYEAVCVGPAFNVDEPVIVTLTGRESVRQDPQAEVLVPPI